jgi:hypothetical protein
MCPIIKHVKIILECYRLCLGQSQTLFQYFYQTLFFSCFLKQQHDSAHAKCEGVGMQKLKAQIKKPKTQLRPIHEWFIYCTPCIL